MNQEQPTLSLRDVRDSNPHPTAAPGLAIAAMLWMLKGLKIGQLDVILCAPKGSGRSVREL